MLKMKESRLIKWVVEETMQMEIKSNCQKDLEKLLVELGWGGSRDEKQLLHYTHAQPGNPKLSVHTTPHFLGVAA